MPEPTKLNYWHKEIELKLTNIDLFILMMLSDRVNKHPKCEALFFNKPDSLASRIHAHFRETGIPTIPAYIDVD